jgi:hypothetical protein
MDTDDKRRISFVEIALLIKALWQFVQKRKSRTTLTLQTILWEKGRLAIFKDAS